MQFLRSLSVVAVLASTAAGARAQCPQWSGAFGSDTAVARDIVALPSSNPPRIFALVDIPAGPGYAATPIGTWDGFQWAPFPRPAGAGVGSLRVFDDGSGATIYVASGNAVVRWNGTTWVDVGTSSAFEQLQGIEVVEENGVESLYALSGFSAQGHVTKWNGTDWIPVGGNIALLGSGRVTSLTSFTTSSGTHLYAGCTFNSSSSLIRWDGTAWTAVPAPAGGFVDIATYDDGAGSALYAIGSFFSLFNGNNFRCIARWSGTAWTNLGGLDSSWATPSADALRVYDDGSGPALYVSGEFDRIAGVTFASPGIARWRSGAWSPVGTGFRSPNSAAVVRHLAAVDFGGGTRLVASGGFRTYEGWFDVGGPALWDGGAWTPLERGPRVESDVLVMRSFESPPFGPAVWVGGRLNGVGEVANVHSIGRWDGAHWQALGVGFDDGFVFAIDACDVGGQTAMYAGGQYSKSGGVTTRAIARWTGSNWAEVGGGIRTGSGGPGSVYALVGHDDGSGQGSCLYVGGYFQQAGPAFISGIARWNGTSWSALGGTTVGLVKALAVYQGELYATGDFEQIGGVAAARIARWNGSTWSALGTGLSGEGRTLLVHDDGSGAALYVGGDFASAGGAASTQRIARWRGGAWSSLSVGIGNSAAARVSALTTYDDPTTSNPVLLACGDFTTAGTFPAVNLARWNGTAWSALPNAVADRPVVAAAQLHEGPTSSTSLYVGGDFTQIGATISPYFAKYFDPCDTDTGVAFCLGDGSGTPCPCGNASLPLSPEGCTNASGAPGSLYASGAASLAGDTLVLRTTGLQNRPLLFFQGTQRVNGGAGTAFGDGLRCAGGTIRRLAIKTSTNGECSYPEGFEPSISSQGLVVAAGTRVYQAWYRDPAPGFCTAATFNTTNGVEVQWTAGP